MILTNPCFFIVEGF